MSEQPSKHALQIRPALWVVLLLTAVTFTAGAAWKFACTDSFRQLCYTDITPLYVARGLFDGIALFLEPFEGRYLEYPVLIGAVMQVAGAVAGSGGEWPERTRTFLLANSVILLACALVTVGATWFTRGATTVMALGRTLGGDLRRAGPRAALLVAVSPVLLLDGTINWDLVAVAFTALALYAWSREAPLLTGVMLGLGGAAKLYPLLLLGPLVVICVRHRRWSDVLRAVVGAVGAWLVVNVPVMVLSFDGWREFYSFSQSRGIDFGSAWIAIASLGGPFLPTPTANTWGTGIFLACCVGVAALAWWCRRATFAQLAVLVIIAFAVTNKVYSPQYALWILPLAALARPRWPAFLLWQLGEVVYFVAIWRHLLGYGTNPPPEGSLGDFGYGLAVVLHLLLTLGFAALVVIDIVRDQRQVQRMSSAAVVV